MRFLLLLCCIIVASCGSTRPIGQPPEMSDRTDGHEYRAMMRNDIPLVMPRAQAGPGIESSLWSQRKGSLLGDRRAMNSGDILTVVIEINDKAEISNSSSRARNGSEEMKIGALFGLPERIAAGSSAVSLDPGVAFNSASKSNGTGTISRNEKLTLRVAATVVGLQPNGVLAIEGLQEIRVNNELRQLVVSGFVRPEDVSRQNEITYDKIASARISYGGRGQISDMQQPRYGQQIADTVLPF